MHESVQRFKDATWPQRIAMIAVGLALVGGALYAIRMWLIPLCMRVQGIIVQVATGYAWITLIVSIFSPSTGKKMITLGMAIFERLVIDPLLLLFRAAKKKDIK